MRHANRQRKIDQARRKTQNRKRHPKTTTKLETNRYGNVVGIPDGWKQTNLSVAALLTARIPFYKAFLGFEKSKYGEQRPILVLGALTPPCIETIECKRVFLNNMVGGSHAPMY